jgi:hypothetical protein
MLTINVLKACSPRVNLDYPLVGLLGRKSFVCIICDLLKLDLRDGFRDGTRHSDVPVSVRYSNAARMGPGGFSEGNLALVRSLPFVKMGPPSIQLTPLNSYFFKRFLHGPRVDERYASPQSGISY